MVFGAEKEFGIKLDGFKPVVVNLNEGHSLDGLWVHDEHDYMKATLLSRMFDVPSEGSLPRPFGVFYSIERGTYEVALESQMQEATEALGKGDLDKLLAGIVLGRLSKFSLPRTWYDKRLLRHHPLQFFPIAYQHPSFFFVQRFGIMRNTLCPRLNDFDLLLI